MIGQGKLMSIQELADYLGVKRHTIYQWRYQGKGPRGITVGGQIRYRPDDVETWLEAHADDHPLGH